MFDKKNLKESISNRFIEASNTIIKRYNISSDSAFCKTISLNNVSFADIKAGKLQVGIHYISILLTIYSEVNSNYIMTGKGSILKEVTNEVNKDIVDKLCLLSAENALLKKENEELKKCRNKPYDTSEDTYRSTSEPELNINK